MFNLGCQLKGKERGSSLKTIIKYDKTLWYCGMGTRKAQRGAEGKLSWALGGNRESDRQKKRGLGNRVGLEGARRRTRGVGGG